jgi:hypothetical protein
MVDFAEVWCCDTEFAIRDDGRPDVACLVAIEAKSGRAIRLGQSALRRLPAAPFDTGPQALFVSYSAPAELGCFLQLGWPFPLNILDLYVEYRCVRNIGDGKGKRGLIDALMHYGLAHLDPDVKAGMRQLAMRGGPWTVQEEGELLDYCESDVRALLALLPAMAPDMRHISIEEALFRGRYMAAVARINRFGIPIDRQRYQAVRENREAIIRSTVTTAEAAGSYGVYDGTHFRMERFREWVEKHGIRWPMTPSGERLSTSDETFRDMAALHPEVAPLRECRRTLEVLNSFALDLGSDDRARYFLGPFGSITGRNIPKAAQFVFSMPKWLRCLIRAPESHGVAYIDWSAQEYAIAAALSGDEKMIEAYRSGDPYIAFAIDAGFAPPDATKHSHPRVRGMCKVCVLGIGYGQGAQGLAQQAGISLSRAEALLRGHRAAYPMFYTWRQRQVNGLARAGEYRALLGWRWSTEKARNPRTVMNFPMQANGAEMMRVAAIAATEAGIEVCAPVHDAFLVCAPSGRLEADIARTQEIMRAAAEQLLGFAIRADCEIKAHFPEHFVPKESEAIDNWQAVCRELTKLGCAAD